jgi:hypothetical protein
MQLDPIQVEEVDNVIFDFTTDVGNQDIVAVEYSCRLMPLSAGSDPAPNERIPTSPAAASTQGKQAHYRWNFEQSVWIFGVAAAGPMPVSAGGATYLVEATAFPDDRVRQIPLSAILP